MLQDMKRKKFEGSRMKHVKFDKQSVEINSKGTDLWCHGLWYHTIEKLDYIIHPHGNLHG